MLLHAGLDVVKLGQGLEISFGPNGGSRPVADPPSSVWTPVLRLKLKHRLRLATWLKP